MKLIPYLVLWFKGSKEQSCERGEFILEEGLGVLKGSGDENDNAPRFNEERLIEGKLDGGFGIARTELLPELVTLNCGLIVAW